MGFSLDKFDVTYVISHTHAGACYRSYIGNPMYTKYNWVKDERTQREYGQCTVYCSICNASIGFAEGSNWQDNTYGSRAITNAWNSGHLTLIETNAAGEKVYRCKTYPNPICEYKDEAEPYIREVTDIQASYISGDSVTNIKLKPKSRT